ncbi:MAG: patatin-like phospholipase family protein [Janthinobacterium lividum]
MTRLALALGGGAGLGWTHIGVIGELKARGIAIDAVAGTSIGALVGVCLAADRLDVLESVAMSTTARQVMRFVDVDLRRGSFLGGRAVARELRRHFDDAELQDLFIPCVVVAADLLSGQEVAIGRGRIVDALRASIAIPGIFPPVRRDGMVLVDGGVVCPVPVRAVRAISDAPVLAINLQGDYLRRAAKGMPASLRILTPMRVGRAGLSLMTSELARQSLALDPPDLELAPAIGHIHVRNFTRAAELIAIGAASVRSDWPRIAALVA